MGRAAEAWQGLRRGIGPGCGGRQGAAAALYIMHSCLWEARRAPVAAAIVVLSCCCWARTKPECAVSLLADTPDALSF